MADQRPEETAALWRRSNGIARVDRVPRDTQFLPHPSNGGTRGYDIPFREFILENYQAGRPIPASLTRSVIRWARRIVPLRMTGNKPRNELSAEWRVPFSSRPLQDDMAAFILLRVHRLHRKRVRRCKDLLTHGRE